MQSVSPIVVRWSEVLIERYRLVKISKGFVETLEAIELGRAIVPGLSVTRIDRQGALELQQRFRGPVELSKQDTVVIQCPLGSPGDIERPNS